MVPPRVPEPPARVAVSLIDPPTGAVGVAGVVRIGVARGGTLAAGWMLLVAAADESLAIKCILMEMEDPGKLLAPRPLPHPDASVVPFARWPPNRILTRQFLLFAGPVHAAAESGPELTVNVMVSCD